MIKNVQNNFYLNVFGVVVEFVGEGCVRMCLLFFVNFVGDLEIDILYGGVFIVFFDNVGGSVMVFFLLLGIVIVMFDLCIDYM